MTRIDPLWRIPAIALGLAILAALFWHFQFSHWEYRRTPLGYDAEAYSNPALAAQLLLHSQGIASERSSQLSKLDRLVADDNALPVSIDIGARDTVILLWGRGIINQGRFDQVWRWVEGGGHFITTVDNPFLGELSLADDLFSELGIYLEALPEEEEANADFWRDTFGRLEPEMSPEDETPAEGKDAGQDGNRGGSAAPDKGEEDEDGSAETPANGDGEPGVEEAALPLFALSGKTDQVACPDSSETTLALPGRREVLQLAMPGARPFVLEDYQPEWTVTHMDNNFASTVGASFAIGDGRITVLSDVAMWRNQSIQCLDHAYFLMQLAPEAGKVWILENRDAPSLLALLWRHLPWLTVLLSLLLLLCLWAWTTRFGPRFEAPVIARRSFAEHIAANAVFMWRQGLYIALLASLRRHVERLLARKILGYATLGREEKCAAVVALANLKPEFVELALHKNAIDTLDEFIDSVKTLKTLKDLL